MKKIYLLSWLLCFVLAVSGQKLPFQGKLIENGTPVNGTRTIQVSVPDIGWSETHTDVSITDGLYFIVLGSINALPVHVFGAEDERLMEISVDGIALSPVTLYKPLSGGPDGLDLSGPGNGFVRSGFLTGSEINENLPFLQMNGNLQHVQPRMNLGVVSLNSGNDEGAVLQLNSTSQDFTTIGSGYVSHMSDPDRGSLFLSDQLYLRNGSSYNLQLFSQNWGSKGHAGTILMRGPNSQIFEISNKHWDNPDLPWFVMKGISNNPLLQMSGEIYEENATQKVMGRVVVLDQDQNKTMVTPREVSLLKADWSQLAGINSHSNAGNLFLNGPDSENLYLGNKSWENSNLPYFVMKGTSGNMVMDMSALNDENEDGYFNLYNRNGYSSSLSTRNIGLFSPEKRLVSIELNNWGAGDFGLLHLGGNSSQVTLKNSAEAEKINLGIVGDEGQSGRLSMKGANPHLTLDDENGENKVLIQSMSGAGGTSGHLDLRGATKTNFYLGSASWANSDQPYMTMNAGNNDPVMVISTYPADGGERAVITLSNTTGEGMSYTSNGIFGSIPFGIYNDASVTGALWVGGDLTSEGTISAPVLNQTSDQRLKTDIRPLGSNILTQAVTLEGVIYAWRKDEFPDKNLPADRQIGFLAQQVESLFPELVTTGKDGFKSVNYNGFTAVLLEAVKELNQKVDALEKENRLLKQELMSASANLDEMKLMKEQIEMLARLVQVKVYSSGDSTADNPSRNPIK